MKQPRRSFPYIVISVIALLILGFAYVVKPAQTTNEGFFFDLLLNVGYMVVTIVIVNALWYILGGDPLQNNIEDLKSTTNLLSDGIKSGLTRFFLSHQAILAEHTWISMLESAKKNIDMMGYSLHAWTKNDAIAKVLIKLAKKGIQVRVMVMSPNNPHFNAGLNYGLNSFTESYMKDEVSLCAEFCNKIKSSLPDDKENNVQMVNIENGLTECQIIRVDDKIYVTPYLYSLNTDESPLFVLKNGEKNDAFDKYLAEFNMLWEKNKA